MKKLMIALIATIALLGVMGCGASREVTRNSESTELRSSDVKDSVLVAVHDTIMETVTITVDRNEAGDTVFTSVVTDRTRATARDRVRDKQESVVVKTDTVFVERRDSVSTTNRTDPTNKASPMVSSLKWIFWIIVSLIVLVIILKYRRF